MNAKIKTTAKEYQKLDREIKDLLAKQKPLKEQIIAYAKEHKTDFDEAFQLKFPNGTYVSQRVKDVVEGTKEAKAEPLGYNETFQKVQLDENEVISQAPNDARLRKFLTKNNIKISQKETFAVYAG